MTHYDPKFLDELIRVYCLPFHLHLLDKISLWKFLKYLSSTCNRVIFAKILGIQKLWTFTVVRRQFVGL